MSPDMLRIGATRRRRCRQVAIAEGKTERSITAVYNPIDDKVQSHGLYAQPFGTGRTVPNLYRLAASINEHAIRYRYISFRRPLLGRAGVLGAHCGGVVLRIARRPRRRPRPRDHD